MHGYFGEKKPPELDSVSLERLVLSTNGRVERARSATLVLEGHLFRFIDSPISFKVDRPLESILELHRAHGEAFIRHLDGLFLLLFQPRSGDPIYLVNNAYQAHRLYFAESEAGVYFSSSLRRLLQLSGIERRVHLPSVRSFLANGFTSSDQTQLKGVHKLLPADYLVFADRRMQRRSYWPGRLRFERRPFRDLEEHLTKYEETYRGSLERFFAAKRPRQVGALLSGGHDTSFLVAQAARVLPRPLHTYTVTFPGWDFDEGRHAENIAGKFGAVHHPVPFTSGHVDRVLSLILANEEPVVGSSLPLHVLSERAGGEVGAMLGGDGGDTLWGEYYPVGEYHRWTHRLPVGARRLLHWAAKTLRDAADWERFWELEHVAGLFRDEDYRDDFLRKLCTYRHFGERFQQQVLAPDVLRESYARSHLQIPFPDESFSDALIEGKLFNGFFPYQAFHTAKSAEYYGMELFLPSVDHDVARFICRLPEEWVNGGWPHQRLSNDKRINRRFHKLALARHLSRAEIYNRSFDIPWHTILRPRRGLLSRLLARLKARGWYNESALDVLFSEFSSQAVKAHELLELKHHGYRIFTMMSLEIWSMEYLDGRSSEDAKNVSIEDYLTAGR